MNRGPAVAVMDVGKTSAKVVAVDRSGVVRRRLAHASRSSDAGPCRHVEVDELFEWIVEALQAVAAAEAIEALVATARGAAAALVDEERLALPVMD